MAATRRRPVRAARESGRMQIADMQRARLLAAAVCEIDERGYAAATVAHITDRARVSRRTFYELFPNREACVVAVLEDAVLIVERELAAAETDGVSWQERVRRGLWAILSLLEREPALARICVVESARGGEALSECRERVLARLAAAVDKGRRDGVPAAGCTALTAEGLVGAALTIVHARLSRRAPEPLTELLGDLCAMIVLPYRGAAAARREQRRVAPEQRPGASAARAAVIGIDPLRDVSMRLTYRTARVLESIAAHPGANNRQVSQSAGVPDQGQVSKLLARLRDLDLIANHGLGHARGEPNAWTLTPKGREIAAQLSKHAINHRQVAKCA